MTLIATCFHGLPFTVSCQLCGRVSDATYVAEPTFTQADKERLFRALDRIVGLLERLTGIAR